ARTAAGAPGRDGGVHRLGRLAVRRERAGRGVEAQPVDAAALARRVGADVDANALRRRDGPGRREAEERGKEEREGGVSHAADSATSGRTPHGVRTGRVVSRATG